MRRLHLAVAIVSALIFSVGVGAVGYAAIQIVQMNTNSGQEFLPKLAKTSKAISPIAFMNPKTGQVIGSLYIPRLKKKLPIIEGTGSKELKMGVGHYSGSVLPGVSDNSVLAGHRDSVFRNLDSVKLGDLITVTTEYGIFVYEVQKIRIVKANDRTVIVPSADAILTLSTCYPFGFIGNAPKRYIVQAGLAIGEAVG